jgi:hypothetical protein
MRSAASPGPRKISDTNPVINAGKKQSLTIVAPPPINLPGRALNEIAARKLKSCEKEVCIAV